MGIGILNSPVGRPVNEAVTIGMTPVQDVLAGVLSPVGGFFDALSEIGQLRSQATEYRDRAERAEAELTRLRETEIENERLRAMLGFEASNKNLTLSRARIIAIDPSSRVRSATITGGRDKGYREGMVALSPAGNLVGRIVEVMATSSRILFIVDSQSKVNARIQRADSRALGIVSGLPGDKLIMRYLPQAETIRVGDIVMTSGLGETFPASLTIGRVVEVKRTDVDLFQEARIEPSVQFSRLDTVQIITNFTPSTLR